MDISKYRKDFPLLNKEDSLIYLDSACMTLRPQEVIDSITEYYTDYPACGGRSVHKLSWQVTEKFEMARDSLRKFVGAEQPSEIVFTKNATEGMNIVANGLRLKKGDHVLPQIKNTMQMLSHGTICQSITELVMTFYLLKIIIILTQKL